MPNSTELRIRSVTLLLIAMMWTSTCGDRQARLPDAIDVMERTIVELSRAMASGSVTSRQLVEIYIARIAAYDKNGPRLNAVLSLNPRARDEADALDRERQLKGPRGLLHGIPIVVKDNFDTADMPTTAASIALIGSMPGADAFQVRKLREAGAVIVAKTNMHELAWGITTVSSLGGQTLNPYGISRNPGGSSGGTAAAVAANLAVVGMGTDTCGSIRYPAAHNNLVGLRTTPGLSSRTGVVPASHTQDVAGPLARTVEDLAIVLDAIVGPDPADPITAQGIGRIAGGFRSRLDAGGLRSARIGVFEPLFGTQPEDQPVARVVRAAIEEMKNKGAEAVPVDIPDLARLLQGAAVPAFEFKFDFDAYLSRTPRAPVRSLAEILEKGLYHAAVDDVLRRSNAVVGLDTKEYRDALARRRMIRETILKAMDEQRVTALAYPTLRRTAAKIGEPQRGGNCTLSSVTDMPAMTVQAGFVAEDGMPVGLELLGRPFADGDLVTLAYAYEQITHHRRAPASTPGLADHGPRRFRVRATGVQQAPAVRSAATATADFTYDIPTRRLDYVVNVMGVAASDVLSAHLHRGDRQERGPVVVLLTPAGTLWRSGSVILAPPEEADLLAGRLYLDVHTRRNLAGELRAQLDPFNPAR